MWRSTRCFRPRLAVALADRYEIERHLGEGGMATVYLAEDLKHQLAGQGHWLPENAADTVNYLLLEHLHSVSSGKAARRTDDIEKPSVTTVSTSAEIPSQGRIGGVAIDARGSIYVANFRGSVWRVDRDGVLDLFGTGFQGSSGNAIDSAGNLLQASFLDGRLIRIDSLGNGTTVATGLAGPVGVTVGRDGAIYVCSCRSNSIDRVLPNGSVETFATHSDLDCPNGITFGPDGALYVVSFKNEHVVRIGSDGTAGRFATIAGGNNSHIAMASGVLYVTKIDSNTVHRLLPGGRSELFAGTGEAGFEDGPALSATISRPDGIAVSPDGSSLVINTLEGEWRGESATRIVLRRIHLRGEGDFTAFGRQE